MKIIASGPRSVTFLQKNILNALSSPVRIGSTPIPVLLRGKQGAERLSNSSTLLATTA